MKERRTTVKFDALADYCVTIIQSSDIKQSIQKRLAVLKCGEVPNLDDCIAITFHIDDVKESMIFLRSNVSVGTIAHECWHVIFRMMDYFGADIEDEMVAYHLDYLCQKTFDFVKRK